MRRRKNAEETPCKTDAEKASVFLWKCDFVTVECDFVCYTIANR